MIFTPPINWVEIFTAIGIGGIPLAWIMAGWIYVVQGWPRKGIVDFCNQTNSPEATMARLEKVWKDGYRALTNFRADDEYLIWVRRLSAGVFPLKDVLWVWTEKSPVPNVPIVAHWFQVYTADGKYKQINVSGWGAEEIEEHLRKNCPDIVVGMDVTMRKCLKRRKAGIVGRILNLEMKSGEERDIEGAKAYIQRRKEARARDSAQGEQ